MVDRSVGIIVLPAVIPSSSINFCTNVVIMFLSLVQCYKCRGLVSFITFFTPIPCSYTSSLLDGVARNFFLHGYARSRNLSHLDPFIFPTSYARGEKRLGIELESNPDPLALQATALTTRPSRLGLP